MSRLLERLEAIYAIAQHRAGYSPAEDAAHELAAEWMREAGLEISSDEAGNLFGRRGAARVWSGSHLDSVPTAGKFDGALGVVAAIEAALRAPDVPLAVVAFRAEETGPMGSQKLTEFPDAFLEVHIEQGPVLANLNEPLGVVTAIGGQARGAKVFEGRADHAGTTPMAVRYDALVQAAEFILHVRDCAGDDAVATVGAFEVEPNAVNVVPRRPQSRSTRARPTPPGSRSWSPTSASSRAGCASRFRWVTPSRRSCRTRRGSSPARATIRCSFRMHPCCSCAR